MSLGRRPPRMSRRGGDGPPAWLIFIVGIALVFGGYYLWLGAQNFLRTGGRGVIETTEQAQIVAFRYCPEFYSHTPAEHLFFCRHPVPECEPFVVSVTQCAGASGSYRRFADD